MKKLLVLLLALFMFNAYSQQIVRPMHDYYLGNPEFNRTDITRAIMDGVVMWQKSGFQEMELPLKQPTLIMKFPKLLIDGVEMITYSKDTIIQIDAFPEKYHVSVEHDYEQWGDNVYTTGFRFVGYQPTRYVMDSVYTQDETNTRHQYFFTKHWMGSHRQHDNLDSLYLEPFSVPYGEPGNTIIDGVSLRRHTFSSITKAFYQMRALDTVTNTIDTLTPRFNRLRIEYLKNL